MPSPCHLARCLLAATVTIALATIPMPIIAQTILVTNQQGASVTLVDANGGGVLTTLPTGNGPHEVAASHDGRLAVVTDYGSQVPGSTLTVIDVPGRRVLRTIDLAPHQRPHGIQFLPGDSIVAVTAEREQLLLLVDIDRGRVLSAHHTGRQTPHMLSLSPDGRTAQAANMMDGSISIVPLATPGAAAVIAVSSRTEAIATSPDGRTSWLGSNDTHRVFVVDLARRQVIDSIQTDATPYRIAFTPDGATALVSNPETEQLWLIDTSTREVMARVEFGPGTSPQGLAVSPDGRTAWVTLGESAEVALVDLGTATVIGRWPTGPSPDGVAYAPAVRP